LWLIVDVSLIAATLGEQTDGNAAAQAAISDLDALSNAAICFKWSLEGSAVSAAPQARPTSFCSGGRGKV